MRRIFGILCASVLSFSLGCGGKSNRAPATTTGGTGNVPRSTTTTVPQGSTRVADDLNPVDDDNLRTVGDPDNIFGRTIDEINADSPLRDVPFDFDSAELIPAARPILDRTAEWLRSYSTVTRPHRRALRRAGHRRVQPGARGAEGDGGLQLLDEPRHPCEPAENHQLREGIPARSRSYRRRLGSQSKGSFRGDLQVVKEGRAS